MLKLISVHFYFLMWLLDNFICVLTFLLESSILKILEYWKRLTLKVQEMLPLLKKLTFPRKYPTYHCPTTHITRNLTNPVTSN